MRKVAHLPVDPLTAKRFAITKSNILLEKAQCSLANTRSLTAELKRESCLPVNLNTLLYVLHGVCNKNANACNHTLAMRSCRWPCSNQSRASFSAIGKIKLKLINMSQYTPGQKRTNNLQHTPLTKMHNLSYRVFLEAFEDLKWRNMARLLHTRPHIYWKKRKFEFKLYLMEYIFVQIKKFKKTNCMYVLYSVVQCSLDICNVPNLK